MFVFDVFSSAKLAVWSVKTAYWSFFLKQQKNKELIISYVSIFLHANNDNNNKDEQTPEKNHYSGIADDVGV